MSGDGRRSVEERLAMLANDPDIETRRARSWQRVRAALDEPAPRPLWPALVALWRPLALASTVAVAAIAFLAFQPPRAVVAAVHGQVTATVGGQVLTLRAGDELPAGASIATPADGWVALRIGDDRLSIDTSSRVTLRELSAIPARVVIDQLSGRTWNVPAKDQQRTYAVRTDGGEATARGTAFLVTTGSGTESEVVTVEGTVQVEAAAGSVLLHAGQSARLTAAPPRVEGAPTTRVEASVAAALRDALGRTCAEAQLPGCLRSGSGFTVLADVASELRIRVKTSGAGAVEVRGGDERAEVSVPGQGTFEIKVSVRRSGTEVRVEIEREAEEVDDDERETPRPSGTRTPEPSETPERSRTPEPSETPERTGTPQPTRTPERSRTPEPSKTPEMDDDDEAEGSATPSPARTSGSETPRPSPTATASR